MVKVSQQQATCIKTANVTYFRLRVFYSMRHVHAENAVLSAGERTWPNKPEKPTEPPAAAEKDDSRARPTGGRCLGGVWGARRTRPEASQAGSTQSGEPDVGPGRGHRPLPPQSPVLAKVNVCLVYCSINDNKTDSKKLK